MATAGKIGINTTIKYNNDTIFNLDKFLYLSLLMISIRISVINKIVPTIHAH